MRSKTGNTNGFIPGYATPTIPSSSFLFSSLLPPIPHLWSLPWPLLFLLSAPSHITLLSPTPLETAEVSYRERIKLFNFVDMTE